MAHIAYGPKHQRRRRAAILALKDYHARTGIWKACPRCGKPMIPSAVLPGEGLDMGHSEAWMKAQGQPGDRLEHANCNRSYGNGTRLPQDWSSVEW